MPIVLAPPTQLQAPILVYSVGWGTLGTAGSGRPIGVFPEAEYDFNTYDSARGWLFNELTWMADDNDEATEYSDNAIDFFMSQNTGPGVNQAIVTIGTIGTNPVFHYVALRDPSVPNDTYEETLGLYFWPYHKSTPAFKGLLPPKKKFSKKGPRLI